MTTVEEVRTAPPETDPEPTPHEPCGRRRRLVWLALAGGLAAAGAGVWLWAANRSGETTPNAAGPVATASVERGTISATESWDGVLDRGAPFTVKSGAQGTVTRVAEQDATVRRGDELFRLDERPTVLLAGTVPMYRDLRQGDAGTDVEQLEANLAELGHGGFTVDDTYDWATAAAVRAWQADIGAEPTGVVARSAVVFGPARGQVDMVQGEAGDVVGPGAPVLDIAGTAQVVNLEIDMDDRDRLAVGSAVTVRLPEGGEIRGRVGSAAAAETGPQPTPEEGGPTEPVVQVEVTLRENAPAELLGAPVEVTVAVDERADVLLVPVTALLALAEGGYGLEVVAEDGTTSTVPVDTGLFAEGKVEVSSPDIEEGTVVGVAGR
jgi:peptidoglycan hydrolase-like protein with peptidoglycan-binding domain